MGSKLMSFLGHLYKVGMQSARLTILATLALVLGTAFTVAAPRMYEGLFFLYHSEDVLYISVTKPDGRRHHGTGFHVTNSKGKQYLLTNRHVCVDAKSTFSVIDDRGGEHLTTLIRMSPGRDLCILESVGNFRSFDIKKSGIHYHEMPLYTIGYPSNMPMTLSRGDIVGFVPSSDSTSVSKEQCEKTEGSYEEIEDGVMMGLLIIKIKNAACIYRHDVIQTNIQIRGGNSGSPLIDIFGNVVGIIHRKEEGNWGQAVPSKDIINFIEEQ